MLLLRLYHWNQARSEDAFVFVFDIWWSNPARVRKLQRKAGIILRTKGCIGDSLSDLLTMSHLFITEILSCPENLGGQLDSTFVRLDKNQYGWSKSRWSRTSWPWWNFLYLQVFAKVVLLNAFELCMILKWKCGESSLRFLMPEDTIGKGNQVTNKLQT